MNDNKSITPEKFSALFGINIKDLPKSCIDFIETNNFSYKNVIGVDKEILLLEVLKNINSNKFTISNEKRVGQWNDGWQQNLDALIASNNVDSLDPKYYRGSEYFRLNKSYIKSENKQLDYVFFKVLRLWIFNEYVKNYSHIYEFGCGPSHNLVALGDIYPEIVLYGLDWAKSSIEIIKLLRTDFSYNIDGCVFDFFKPDYQIDINENGLFITFGGLEQIGTNYNNFFNFILNKKPKTVIHIEPIIEFYEEDSLIDYLAILYHKKRNYLDGYYTSLLKANKEGKINIIKSQRLEFGGLFHEGWSIIIFDIIN